MELRSSRRRNEYKELQITLNGMGFYEEGMELQEMRQILDALHQSVTETEANFFDDDDMERAIRESEMDFMPSNNGGLLNSTMMGSQQTSSPCSSPEIPSQVIIVQAEIHHPLNWSPPCTEDERLQRKRLATTPTRDTVQLSDSSNEIIEPNAKRSHQYEDPASIHQPFLINAPGVNLSNDSDEHLHSASLSSLHNISNGSENNNTIEIIGPVSVRRPINDSGVNSGNESNKSTSTTNNDNSGGDSNVNGNISLSSSSSHEIVGPISARRPINDSGVNISNVNGDISSSSWEFNMSAGNSMEEVANDSRLPFSIGRNGLQNYDDDDFEHSEPSI